MNYELWLFSIFKILKEIVKPSRHIFHTSSFILHPSLKNCLTIYYICRRFSGTRSKAIHSGGTDWHVRVGRNPQPNFFSPRPLAPPLEVRP